MGERSVYLLTFKTTPERGRACRGEVKTMFNKEKIAKEAAGYVIGEEIVFSKEHEGKFYFAPKAGYEKGIMVVVDIATGQAIIKSPLGFEPDRDVTSDFKYEYRCIYNDFYLSEDDDPRNIRMSLAAENLGWHGGY